MATFRRTALIGLGLFALAIGAQRVHAVVHSLSYTVGQDAVIQARHVGIYNRDHCRTYRQVLGCTSANLVSGGCTVSTAVIGGPGGNVTVTNESCTIFTADTAGEDAMLQELANQDLARMYVRQAAEVDANLLTTYHAASAGTQATVCQTNLGIAATQCPQ